MGTKRLARKKLARFETTFFNDLHKSWRKNPDDMELITEPAMFPELADSTRQLHRSNESLGVGGLKNCA